MLLLAAALAHDGHDPVTACGAAPGLPPCPPARPGPGFPFGLFGRWTPPPAASADPVDVQGTLTLDSPDWVLGTGRARIAARYTVGSGIVAGGGLKLSLGHLLPTEQELYTPFSLTVTSAYFFKVNLLQDVAVEGPPGVRLKVHEPRPGRAFGDILKYVKFKRGKEGSAQRDGWLRRMDNEFAVRVEVVEGTLRPGDQVRIVLGANEGLLVPKNEASWEVVARVDGDGNDTWGVVPEPPTLDVYTRRTTTVVAIAPSNLYPGETARMVLHPEDDYFLPNLPRFERGVVRLGPQPGLSYPAEVVLPGGLDAWDGSVVEVPVTGEVEGVYRIRGEATIDGQTFPVLSNPVAVVPADTEKVWFGDLHLHSVLSYDADRPPGYVYWRQRRQERHDFAALTDHDMIGAVPFASRATVSGRTPDEWSYAKRLANEWNEPGRFVTLQAYEWTSYWFGHRNVFFAGTETDPPLFHHNYPSGHDPGDEESPGELRDRLAEHRYVAIPHSTAWPTKNVQYVWGPSSENGGTARFGDPSAWPEQRVLELYSTHGTSELHDNEYAVDQGHPEVPLKSRLLRKLLSYDIQQAPADSGNFAQDALGAGWQFGFVGSSDDHYLSHLDQAYRYGYGAVYAPALTRDGIWDGLWARRTYAVTGERILLSYRLDDVPMGGAHAPGAATARVVVHGTGPLDFVELVRFDGAVWTTAWTAPGEGALDLERTAPMTLAPGELYYVRVRQVDGHRAWSSPIWVSASAAAPPAP